MYIGIWWLFEWKYLSYIHKSNFWVSLLYLIIFNLYCPAYLPLYRTLWRCHCFSEGCAQSTSTSRTIVCSTGLSCLARPSTSSGFSRYAFQNALHSRSQRKSLKKLINRYVNDRSSLKIYCHNFLLSKKREGGI